MRERYQVRRDLALTRDQRLALLFAYDALLNQLNDFRVRRMASCTRERAKTIRDLISAFGEPKQ